MAKPTLYHRAFPITLTVSYIQTLEDNRFSVTFSGYANAHAPNTNEEFISYAKKLPVPDVLRFLEGAEPLSEIKIHRVPYQVRRRFDLAKTFRKVS